MPPPAQARRQRSDRNIENLGGLLIGKTLHQNERDHLALLIGQLLHGAPDIADLDRHLGLFVAIIADGKARFFGNEGLATTCAGAYFMIRYIQLSSLVPACQ